MKRKLVIPVLIILASALCCASARTTGWLNNDTLVVSATGYPPPGDANKTRRRIIAREQAIANARKQILRECLRSSYDNYMAHQKKRSESMPTAHYDPDFSGGSILKMDYDADDVCTLMYRMQKKNLKKFAREMEERFK